MTTQTDPMEAASHTLDRVAARLETLAAAWRAEADYMRNGDRSRLGELEGREVRYIDATRESLLRYLATEANRIVKTTHAELDDITLG